MAFNFDAIVIRSGRFWMTLAEVLQGFKHRGSNVRRAGIKERVAGQLDHQACFGELRRHLLLEALFLNELLEYRLCFGQWGEDGVG